MEAPGDPGSSEQPRRLRRLVSAVEESPLWKALGIGAAAITTLALVWGALHAVLSRSDLDLLVFIEKDNALFPSGLTGDHPLPLDFEGSRVGRLTTMEIYVSNEGTAILGSQQERWRLDLTVANAEQVAGAGQPRADRAYAAFVPGGDSATQRLELGALESGETIQVYLMVVCPGPGQASGCDHRFPELTVDTTLDGIPPPTVTRSEPESRIGVRLWPWSVALSALLGLVIMVNDPSSRPPAEGGKPRWLAKQTLILVGFAAITGTIAALVFGWLLTPFF